MAADALSDVLRTVRLTGATFFDIVAKAPWVAEQPPREKILPKITLQLASEMSISPAITICTTRLACSTRVKIDRSWFMQWPG